MRALALIAPIAISVVAAAAFALAPSGQHARAQSTTTIEIGDLWFCNESFSGGVCETTVTEGDTVEWQWTGSAPHTTTECGGDLENCPEPHLWSSPEQDAGTFSHTFDTPGTYVYRCQVHPSDMRGSITVEAGAQATTQPSPEATPQASPGASPQATPGAALPSAGGPSAVPSGGGAPPSSGGADVALWLALAGGFLLAATGSLVALRVRCQ